MKSGELVVCDSGENQGKCGVIQRVHTNSVHVVNQHTKDHFLTHMEMLRPMNEMEEETYCETPFATDQHPQVTLRRKLEVLATWDDETPGRRMNGRIRMGNGDCNE